MFTENVDEELKRVCLEIEERYEINILHFDKRKLLLNEAHRVISKNGKIFIIHWRKDIDTPR